DGENISDLDITERAKLGVAYGFQQPVRFKGLTVRDMLDLSAKETLKEEAICGLMDQVGLCTKDYIDREVNASLSGGEIKRIEIATVLARKDAKVMVFDEPEAGIDLWSFNGLIDSFERLKKENDKALLVISHQERLLSIADEIIVIQDGKVRIQGPTEEIMPQLMYDERSSSCPIGKDPEWLKEFQLSRAGA
ncbi:MAG: ATP-binding cassette domain-containing protein, partial [Firmicutes bacterium]|nr:ATP-binding cassette domain-containing protein [Bacillota bacterium]